MVDRQLDFIVIGVQKGGTTSLWRYLRGHPELAMPNYKEAPVFCAGVGAIGPTMERFIESNFHGVSPQVRLGKVATHYMMGLGEVGTDEIVERIADMLPRVRLIALLRDPIERAISQYRMSRRRGLESRSFDSAMEELLRPAELKAARDRPTESNSYLVQGEYGRILRAYYAKFAADQILVEYVADLAQSPALVLDRVSSFLGVVPGYRPEGLDIRHHRGGMRSRIDAEGEARLREFMGEHVWSKLGDEAEHVERTFDFFLQTWNVVPDSVMPDLSKRNRAKLEAHYRHDAEALAGLDIAAPWLELWQGSDAQGALPS